MDIVFTVQEAPSLNLFQWINYPDYIPFYIMSQLLLSTFLLTHFIRPSLHVT